MELNDWLAIIGVLGGSSTLTWGVTTWRNRKTNARKENASALSAEIQNLLTIIESLNSQIGRLEKNLTERNGKVDFLYVELRKSEEKCLETLSRLHEVELKLKEAELSRCDIWDCLKRIPPKFKQFIKREEEIDESID
jgi:peptidoglycan hydrolase CwlO-like protein